MFLTHLRNSNGRMVGFNNLAYDYPMVHMIMSYSGMVTNEMLYSKSQSIINADFNDWSHQIWDADRFIPQIDLLKIHHFDNQAKRTSLKMLEFNMRMDSIEELELDFNKPVKPSDVPVVLNYNDHDTNATNLFYGFSHAEIAFREQLSEKYGKDFMNHNDTRIGQEFFVMELAKKGIKAGKWNQTFRSSIRVADIILPYVQFERPEFNEILKFFRESIINPEQIKGFFGSKDPSKSKCTQPISWEMASVMEPQYVKVNYTDGTNSLLSKLDKNKKVKSLIPVFVHCLVDGFQFDFGAGGIHGSVNREVVKSDENECIIDVDVSSYYPNLAIKNRFYPLHLGEAFCDAYLDVYEQRKQYPKKTAENNMLKLALNGVYGKSNDKHSPFYDPQYTMSITINGQLLLCMLAEQLMKTPGLKMIQINTDGLTFKVNRNYINHVESVCTWWESVTQLELEGAFYSLFCVRDCNSYIAVFE